MNAKIQYKASGLQQQNLLQLVHRVGTNGYVAWAVSQMSLPQVEALETVYYQQVRNDRVPKASCDMLVPELVQMRATKLEMEKAIEAVEAATEKTFVEDYFDNGLVLDRYETLMSDRINALKTQVQNTEVEQEVQRRLAAMGNNADAMTEG